MGPMENLLMTSPMERDGWGRQWCDEVFKELRSVVIRITEGRVKG